MSEGQRKWFYDYVSPDFLQLYSIRGIIYSGSSSLQSIEIIETGGYGLCLVLDGKIQSSQADEFIYHEALVHPPMLLHPHPKRVFIAGGGEGATLREVLAHRTVQRVVMVDIDEELVRVCQKYLPSWHQGSFEDRRVELIHTDARKYLEENRESFDVVIIDLPEPVEEGPAYLLYTREFYSILKDRLGEEGVICVQSGSASWGNLECFATIVNTLKSAFPLVFPYQAEVPSFGGGWGFSLATYKLDPRQLPPGELGRRISLRVAKPLRFYDEVNHQGLFLLPKCHRQELDKESRVITDDEPLFIFH